MIWSKKIERKARKFRMQYDFLKQFPKRMKHVGMYGVLIQNSIQKQTWKQYGIMKLDDQLNFIFALLLYIMEQSLKEEKCTMDDIGAFLDDINSNYFQKNLSYEDCKKLGDFIVNVILSNEGKTMTFEGYDFEYRAYQFININYVANKIVYVDDDVKRTSYRLTDDGYNLLLSTLEIESNMRLTIQEMIFKLHLEKQSYDKAVDDIKNIFNMLRMQLQKIQDAMLRVRRNALNYSVADYDVLLKENMEAISHTKQKFQNYRENVRERAIELEEQNINIQKLSKEDEDKLNNLRMIENYLNKGIDEHQKILNAHFDLKHLYDKELELLAQMSLIQRFSLRTELYDKLLTDVSCFENLDIFLRSLFHQEPDKIYNLNKAMELQRPIKKKRVEDEHEIIDFDEGQWQEEQNRAKKERLQKYEKSLRFIFKQAVGKNIISLDEIKEGLTDEDKEVLIPDIDIFKEIMVELIKSREIDIPALRKEKSEFIVEETMDFQLHEMILRIAEQYPDITKVYINRTLQQQVVEFEGVKDKNGIEKTIRCSNVQIMIEE